MMEHIEYLPLSNGRHTSCTPLICGDCGKIDFMPNSNWDLFLKEGIYTDVEDWEVGLTQFVNSRKITSPVKLKGLFVRILTYIFGKRA
jgi:hypothetical protein